jgi:molybdopterin converting factor small subunit
MIEVHLYGKLRRFTGNQDASSASIARVGWESKDTVGSIVDRLGIPHDELGSNKFLNGRYATLESPVQDSDRLGLFPDDMQLLYKWYFAPQDKAGTPSQGSRAPNQDSAAPTSANEDEE